MAFMVYGHTTLNAPNLVWNGIYEDESRKENGLLYTENWILKSKFVFIR